MAADSSRRAKSLHAWRQVLVDVNWRPVFFDDEAKAKEAITPYVLEADMVKVGSKLFCHMACVVHDQVGAITSAASDKSMPMVLAQVTEDEAEWLFDIPGSEALSMPERVRL